MRPDSIDRVDDDLAATTGSSSRPDRPRPQALDDLFFRDTNVFSSAGMKTS